MEKIPFRKIGFAGLALAVLVAIRCCVSAGYVWYYGGSYADAVLTDPWFYIGILAAAASAASWVILYFRRRENKKSQEQ